MYRFENVQYRDILKIDSLKINAHRITSIVGPSGVGKTTLLKMLNMLISPDSGEIYYQKKAMSLIEPISHRRQVVMLPQNPVLYGDSIEESLQMGRMFSKRSPAPNNSLKQVLKEVMLDKTLASTSCTLSGGEKQRLALATILLMQPNVLLLDEPSAALDKDTEQNIINTVCNYAKNQKKTVIMITHATDIAEKYSDCILYMTKKQPIIKKEVTK